MHTLVCGKDQADAGFESGLVNLMLTSHNEAIKTLFHQSTSDLSNPHVLTTHFQSLFVYFCYAFILGLLTYGIAVPSGLFVPAIMSGAAMGRYPNPNPPLTLNPKPKSSPSPSPSP